MVLAVQGGNRILDVQCLHKNSKKDSYFRLDWESHTALGLRWVWKFYCQFYPFRWHFPYLQNIPTSNLKKNFDVCLRFHWNLASTASQSTNNQRIDSAKSKYTPSVCDVQDLFMPAFMLFRTSKVQDVYFEGFTPLEVDKAPLSQFLPTEYCNL